MPTPKKPKTPPPAAAPKEPKPVVTREPSEFQKFLADIVGAMIARGANEADAESLLRAAMSYHWKQTHPSNYLGTSERRSDAIEKFIKDNSEDWELKLRIDWGPRGIATPVNKSVVQTVTERIRADYRSQAELDFRKFVAGATPEEILLAIDILERWDSSNPKRPEDGGPEIHLAHAFANVFGNNEHYIKVPAKHWNLVVDYLSLLDGKECGEAA